MFYNSYLGGGLLISGLFAGCSFSAIKTSFFLEQNQAKAFQMSDPHFRLYISVYRINKIIRGPLEIWNLSSGQIGLEKISSISLRAHVLFST